MVVEHKFKSLKEFYPFYLSEHRNRVSRILHFIGTGLVILIIPFALIMHEARFLLLVPVIGYGFAWVGHYFFERNKPATFKHPLYSLASDFKLFFDLLSGKEKF